MSLTLEKNRLFIVAMSGVLALAVIAYVVGPSIVASLVERAYYSNAAPWPALMRHRDAANLAAYQTKGIGLFRYWAAVGLVALLTLCWMLWDHGKARFSLGALALPATNLRTLSVLGTVALILLSIRGYLPYLLPLLVGLLTLFARESWQPFTHFNRILAWILKKEISLPLVLLLAVVSFLVKFPPQQFDSLVMFDDYPTIYTVTMKGWEMLKQGGIFGWDPRLMGGYHTVSDVSHDEIFFMLPFLPFGPRVGFHLMIMFFYLLFPLLLYWHARLELGEERPALFVLWIGLFVVFGYFDNLLYWGMVNSFLGLDFMLLNLILFTLMRQGKPYASFALILSLSLTLYAAGGFFAYSLLLLALDLFWHFATSRKLLPRLALIGIATLLVTLTFTYHFLRYPSYFVQSDEIYAPPRYTVSEIIAQSVGALSRLADPRLWLLGRPVRYQGMFIVSIPILLSLAWSSRFVATTLVVPGEEKRPKSLLQTPLKVVIAAILIMLTSLVVSPSLDMFISRVRFVLPAILALAYGAWLCQEKRVHPAPLLIVWTLLLTILPSRLLEPIRHETSLRTYNGPLLKQIESLDSDLLLLESMGGYDLATEGPGSTQAQETHVHLESYFPLETSKSYLANNQEGYHHSIYRRNFITSGAFRGRLLGDWPREEIKAFLDKWGVKHLILWSKIAIGYFDSDPDFRRLWSDGFWAIYEYRNAVPDDVIVKQGKGEITVRSYFEQDVQLSDVRGGDLVTLRMNYFPAWRAYYHGRPVELLDNDGLMAFVAPADGSYTISLHYPRYTGLTVLALATLAVSGLLSYRLDSLPKRNAP